MKGSAEIVSTFNWACARFRYDSRQHFHADFQSRSYTNLVPRAHDRFGQQRPRVLTSGIIQNRKPNFGFRLVERMCAHAQKFKRWACVKAIFLAEKARKLRLCHSHPLVHKFRWQMPITQANEIFWELVSSRFARCPILFKPLGAKKSNNVELLVQFLIVTESCSSGKICFPIFQACKQHGSE